MMNAFKMKISSLLTVGAMVAFFVVQAQERPKIEPKLTEVWSPVPAKVTPGENNAAPSDAIVLFDGKDLNEWTSQDGGVPEWIVESGVLTVKPRTGVIKTKEKFGDFQLHIEWRAPSEVKGEGQGRGNSGIFMMERYELQVLDSYESVTYSNGQAGSMYKQSIPLVNACKAPGEWQTYDVIFMAPVFTEKGSLKSPAKITLLHNGILVQNGFELKGPTEYDRIPMYEPHGKGSLVLQDHGNPVSYRNIWIREL